jgi:NAD-dependent dihydropyrimidine dehydrogenase PreA subunit
MGHLGGKDIFNRVGNKIDSLHVRCTMNDDLKEITRALFTEDEAEVFVRLPYVFSTLERICKITGLPEKGLELILGRLSDKGLVVDIWVNERYHYMPSPMIIGIFEFTMMRTGKDSSPEKWGPLFYRYLENKDSIYDINHGDGELMSPARVLPHEESSFPDEYTRILDYESAASITDSASLCAVGLCSCRHEKLHAGVKKCDLPLDTCASFGWAADYLIRHNMARKVSASEMKENLALSRERGLVLCADNVRRNVTFICQCCSCCCNLLLGITKHGYPNTVVTSSFIAVIDKESCTGCSKCEKACPVNAITMVETDSSSASKTKKAVVNEELCLGCGVCTLLCKTGCLMLNKRSSRFIHPETTFERVILQCLERGTLQNQIFDNPESITQSFMRGLIKGFLKIVPTKQIEMSETLRSAFLASARLVVKIQGKGWITEL